jgi:hypothetical protein
VEQTKSEFAAAKKSGRLRDFLFCRMAAHSVQVIFFGI